MRTFLNLLKGLFLIFCIPCFIWKQKMTVYPQTLDSSNAFFLTLKIKIE